ncbi:glycosyl transferase, partial [Pelagibacteraceae bacterium GOM-A5]
KKKYEVILINDFSIDNSKQIIKKYKSEIVYIENDQNKGLPYSLNIGIKKAKGKYMVRLDSDDYVNRKYLEILYEFLNWNENFDAVSCDYLIIDDNENIIKRENSSENPIGCGIMFKMDKLLDIGLYNPEFLLHEDKELMRRFIKKNTIYNIKLPLYRYRKHSSNITNNTRKSNKYIKKLNLDDN